MSVSVASPSENINKRSRTETPNPFPVNPELLRFLVNTRVETLIPRDGIIFVCRREDKIVDVWQGLIRHNFLSVPVIQKTKDKYYGFLDMADIVQNVVETFGKSKLEESEDFWKLIHEDDLFQKRTVGDIMASPRQFTNPFHPVSVGFSLFSAVELMAREEGLHRIPVIDENRKLFNIVTQSQVMELLNNNLSLIGKRSEKPVGQIKGALKEVFSIQESEEALHAFKLMTSKGVSGLAVVNSEGKLVGNISLRDLKAISSHGRMFWRLFQSTKNFLIKVKQEYEEKHGIPQQVQVLHPTDTLRHAIEQLAKMRIHRMYISDPNTSKPIGVLSLKDILLELITDI